jgi:predicted TIM-barrel fold metal-dependent hydrolase
MSPPEANAKMPTEYWDCHVHVFGDPGRFPLANARVYTPQVANVEDLRRHLDRQGDDRVVVVQPSVYGVDCNCLMDALEQMGGRAVGIAGFDPDATVESLSRQKRAGIRGVRVNIGAAVVKSDGEAAERSVRDAMAQAAAMGWHIQIYAEMDMIGPMAGVLGGADTPVVIDHFGLTRAKDGLASAGFQTLLGLLQTGNIYVKTSLAERLAEHPEDMGPFARALIQANPERILWGSDWPHSRRGSVWDQPAPFGKVDDRHMKSLIQEWCSEPSIRHMVLSENPRRLFA